MGNTIIKLLQSSKFKRMKTKCCELCKTEHTTMYRVQVDNCKIWLFVGTNCCNKVKLNTGYKYGGTWKGYRH